MRKKLDSAGVKPSDIYIIEKVLEKIPVTPKDGSVSLQTENTISDGLLVQIIRPVDMIFIPRYLETVCNIELI